MMREALFIKKNADKWKSYRERKPGSPDETAEEFITRMDDLSFAKTFYPKSRVTAWLNGLAASAYQNVYRAKAGKYARLFSFWKFELPLIIYRHRRTFLLTALSFILFVAIGVFSSFRNPDFISGTLGDEYVRMTQENISKGDPFGVYRGDSPFNMFVRIGFNNIRVAFSTFLGGFTLGYFTLFFLWHNGLMLGAFQSMFFANGLGLRSILVIWIHGTIEISSLIIAGAAGFILPAGFLFPGSFTRLESFRRSAKDAVKILVCLIPFFITAAFLESYITHLMSASFGPTHRGLPVWASILILLASLYLIVGYFVIRPLQLARKGYSLKENGLVSRSAHA